MKFWRYFEHVLRSPFASQSPSSYDGFLGTFCAACPQPGVNIPENWQEDPYPKAYTRSFVMDGNFSAVHQQHVSSTNDVHLANGQLFMTETEVYHDYLSIAKEEWQVRRHGALFWTVFYYFPRLGINVQSVSCYQ